MKPMFKKVICIALVVLALLATACAKGEYKKDINVDDVAEALMRKTPTQSAWIDEDEGFIEEYIKLPEYVKGSHIYYAQNTNDLDEFGIFEVEEGKANAVRFMLTQGYLQKRYAVIKNITAIKKRMGTSLKTVPIILINAACLTPARTAKFIIHITALPPIIAQTVLPPVNVPGKKKSMASIKSTANPTLPKILHSQ